MADATPITPPDDKPAQKPEKAPKATPVKGVPLGNHDAVRVDF